ncbi:LisH domain and HEAT repeat-containing protein, partial [Ananas comosus]
MPPLCKLGGVADPQTLLEEKVSTEEKLALTQYELRLAQEDLSRLKSELQKQKELSPEELNGPLSDASVTDGLRSQRDKRETTLSSLGLLKDSERKDLNCAVKEYLLFAGYRLTAMTFIEEVTDQNLDVWPNSSASVSDALRRYYYQYLSTTSEAAEEKIAILRENESLIKENEKLRSEKNLLLKNKESADGQIVVLKKSLEAAQKDLKDRDILVQNQKQLLEIQRKELNDCRAEITALKMHIEGARSSKQWAGESEVIKSLDADNSKEETKLLQSETENIKRTGSATNFSESIVPLAESKQPEEVVLVKEVAETSKPVESISDSNVDSTDHLTSEEERLKSSTTVLVTSAVSCNGNTSIVKHESPNNNILVSLSEDKGPVENIQSPTKKERASEKMALETIQILSDALPKIVPYVLINHREELLPLIMCAIERHPESSVRDSLTHTLFNLIKRPDEQQRRIIMEACVTLAKNIGEMRTETELLPQCWEQINHKYEERRLLVAQSCGELAEYVRPEIRDSLILSIVQQLIEDSATVVREAAAHNLALLLPLFPNMDKYFKVEELMFQLVCDPSGVVVDTTLKKLVPAVIKWGGERERWNIDVLLRMLTELLPFTHRKAIETCPFTSSVESLTSLEKENSGFSSSLLQLYATGHMEWTALEWMHIDCLPDLIQLARLLPQKEDNLRSRITKYLLGVSECYGRDYAEHIMLPVFLAAIGDSESADFTFFPLAVQSKVQGLAPKTAVSSRLAIMCVLPLLLSGILGSPSCREQLGEYLRNILIQNTVTEGSFTFEEHQGIVFNVLWEMVVSSNVNMKTNAATLLKVLVPYIDVKMASTHVLPALVTLGSDQNLNVKYASIDAFGAVAQHFKNEMIVDKIRVQMDAFLEDGSHEATVSVVRALLTSLPSPGSDIARRRERANAFCEAIRALDATDLPATSIRDFLLPSIQNLLKDTDALDPAHKEALEVIARERSGGTFESISKVMGAHLGLASSVSSFFGESGLLGKKETGETHEPPAPPQPSPQAQQDDTRFRRIMRSGFGDMLRGKGKGYDESPNAYGGMNLNNRPTSMNMTKTQHENKWSIVSCSHPHRTHGFGRCAAIDSSSRIATRKNNTQQIETGRWRINEFVKQDEIRS